MSDVLAPNHGTMTRYTGGSRRRRARGYCTVREPAMGFFIAGSNIEDLNGLYVRQHPRALSMQQKSGLEIGLAYVHDQTKWLMAMSKDEKENGFDEDDYDDDDDNWEWFFIDPLGRKIFRHKGDTIIPGSGTRWTHCVAGKSFVGSDNCGDSSERAALAKHVSDEDALPWQVIALLDAEIVHKIRWYFKCHNRNIERAIEGVDLAEPDIGSVEHYSLLKDTFKSRSKWLWRVVADGGVVLYGEPRDTYLLPTCQKRPKGSYVLVLERSNDWVRIQPLGDVETSYDFDYGNDGVWTRTVDDRGNVLLVEVPEELSASISATPVDDPVLRDLFDRPFEPRILGESLATTALGEGVDDDDDDVGENAVGGGRDEKEEEDRVVETDPIEGGGEDGKVVGDAVVDSKLVATVNTLLSSDRACPLEIKNAIERLGDSLTTTTVDESDSKKDDDVKVHVSIVRCLLRLRQDKDALKAAKRGEKCQENATTCLWVARCHFRCGESAKGVDALRKGQVNAATSSDYAAISKHLRAFKRVQRSQREAQEKYVEGRFLDAAKAYTEATETLLAGLRDDKQTRATILTSRAACYRRSRDFEKAIADCDAALSIYPRFTRALFRRGACLLEFGKPEEALKTMERLLRFDRNFPDLIDWLVRISAVIKRSTGHTKCSTSPKRETSSGSATDVENENDEGPTLPDADNYYVALGVSTDATAKQLKRAFRLKSLQFHPDRPGGSTIAFQRIRHAYEILSDEDERRNYDAGVDTKKSPQDDDSDSDDDEEEQSLYEEVERKYFPERYKFHPFGDPLIEKRKRQARRRREEEERKRWGW
eukprot:g4481.t1